MISAKEVAAIAAKALDSKLGKDISLIEITDVSTLADYFLICTATSNTHVKTLCDAVEEAMDAAGEPLLNREGHRGGTWVLMDFGSVVVHVFTAETRSFDGEQCAQFVFQRACGRCKQVRRGAKLPPERSS